MTQPLSQQAGRCPCCGADVDERLGHCASAEVERLRAVLLRIADNNDPMVQWPDGPAFVAWEAIKLAPTGRTEARDA